MTKNLIHKKIVENHGKVLNWFEEKRQGLAFNLYSSFDIRDSGCKIAPVDANVFPAGFNNICAVDKESAASLVGQYLESHYGPTFKRVLLVTEEHTKNSYYWENVYTLLTLIEETEREVYVTFPQNISDKIVVQSINGHQVTVWPTEKKDGELYVDGAAVDLIISNNDFTDSRSEWVEGIDVPINPPHEMGWHIRRKHEFFEEYNNLAAEFAQLVDLNPSFFNIKTEVFHDFDINDENSRESLALKVEEFLDCLKNEYKEMGSDREPYVFVKNASGTYGLGVTSVASGDEIRNWTYKARKKMKATKGGGLFTQLIIQEGISTEVISDGDTAEPAIYMVGCQLAGGFLRAHSKKNATESLNSPGAVFKRLCLSDLEISVEGHLLENVYGWVARLGALAIAKEAQKRQIQYKSFLQSACESTK